MAYSPAFQVYYKDFRQDPKTICMDACDIGAYWLLIMECWDRDNTLPDDLEELALIARVPDKKFVKMWESKIKRCFQFDGRRKVFWHKRLRAEIEKQIGWSQEQSERGKKGAEKRWAEYRKKQGLDSDAMAPPSSGMALDSSSFSFSSSSSNFTTNESVNPTLRDTPQAASPPKEKPKRGTRIPEPFMLTAKMKTYAAEKRPTVNVIEETEKFVNHFRAATGRTATKLDWEATWRNWILNSRGNGNGTNRKSYQDERAQRAIDEQKFIDDLRQQSDARRHGVQDGNDVGRSRLVRGELTDANPRREDEESEIVDGIVVRDHTGSSPS